MAQTKDKNQTLYQCPECKLYYKNREWAKKCETWCKEHKSCNLEIIKYSMQSNGN